MKDDAYTDPPTPCPKCGKPTGMYYSERDTWKWCKWCAVYWWAGTGHSDPTGYRPPPSYADPVPKGFPWDGWEELPR